MRNVAAFTLASVLAWVVGFLVSGLLLLILEPGEAHGATYYVSASGSGSWAGAINPVNPASIATCNDNVDDGDVVYLQDGSFGTGLDLKKGGTAGARITIIGNLANPSAVVLPSIKLGAFYGQGPPTYANDRGSHVTVRGVRVTGSIDSRSWYVAPWIGTVGDSLIDIVCALSGGLDISSLNGVKLLRVTGTVGGTLDMGGRSSSCETVIDFFGRNSTLEDCDLTVDRMRLKQSKFQTFIRTRIRVVANSSNPDQPWALYNSQGGYAVDSRFESTNNSPNTECKSTWDMRDSTGGWFFHRDTIMTHDGTGAAGSSPFWLSNSGCAATPQSRNTWREVLFDLDHDVSSAIGMLEYQDGGYGDSLIACTVINRRADRAAINYTGNNLNTHFDHVTVFSAGRLAIEANGRPAAGASIKGTILASLTTPTAGNPTLRVESGVTFDRNLVWSAGGDSTLSVDVAGTTSSPSALGVGRFRSPRFTDSTSTVGDFSRPDVRPRPESWALGTYWPNGAAGAFGAGSDPPGDVTAPDQVSDLNIENATGKSLALSWTATGDDGSTGTATYYDIRYSTSAINSGNWASASQFTGEPTPQASGAFEEWTTPQVLSPQTTYHVAMKACDDAGNCGDLSNVASATTPDDIRPDFPSNLVASYHAPGVAKVTFTATGDDSLVGTATTYDLRYGLGANWFPSSALWDAAGVQARTYRYDLEPAPRVAGSAETIYVWGLQPGQVYTFMLRVVDDVGNPSGYSNEDSVAIPAMDAAETEPYPRIGIYSVAGTGSANATWPLLNQAQTALQTAYLDSLARFPVIALPPAFTDDSSGTAPRHLAFAALRYLRQQNPTIRILAGNNGTVGYVGNWKTADSTKAFAYYHKQVRAIDRATGDSLRYLLSTTGGGQVVDSNGGSPGGYGAESTYVSPLIRKKTPGWKQHMWDVDRTQTFGGQGSTLSNLNITDPRVRDSLVAVEMRHHVLRVDPATGQFAYDGLMKDLNQPDFYQANHSNTTSPWLGVVDSVDYSRLGFASRIAFDSSWVQAHHHMLRALRRACIEGGRPTFIITGNSRSGIATATQNGWMREGWPGQQGGTWHTNMLKVPGGQINDAEAFGFKPQMSWVFDFPATSGNDSLAADSTIYSDFNYRQFRYVLGTASLTGARAVFQPPYASLARAGVGPRWYGSWWFDESSVISGASTSSRLGVGWLGLPLARFRQTNPLHGSGTGRHALADAQGGVGDFDDAGDMSSWSLSGSGTQGLVSRVVDTTYAGAGALRIRIGTRQSVDWQAGGFSTQDGNYTNGDTISVEFWGRASARLPMSVGVRDSASGANMLNVAAGNKVWFDTTWTHHRLVGTATATSSGGPYFWAGDTTGTFWVDEVKVIRGRPRGGLFYREFENGVVVVNPYASVDTFTVPADMVRLTGTSGRAASVNNGATIASGGGVPVPAGDAVFLFRSSALDNAAPDAIADLAIVGRGLTRLAVAWTAPSADGAAAYAYEIRYSTSAIDAGNWSSAAIAPDPPTPAAPGVLQGYVIPALSPLTTYHVAMKALDKPGNVSALSNVPQGATRRPSDDD